MCSSQLHIIVYCSIHKLSAAPLDLFQGRLILHTSIPSIRSLCYLKVPLRDPIPVKTTHVFTSLWKRVLQFEILSVCAAPDYNSRDDKSLSVWVLLRRITALMMILCQERQPSSLSLPFSVSLSLSPLSLLRLSKDKFLSTAPVALSQIPLWCYQVWCQWVVLHLFNRHRLIKVRRAQSLSPYCHTYTNAD